MDRRQIKSRRDIFAAFGRLLTKKRFSNITVGEIIAEADVCRSTFYSHFETKDALLSAFCSDIFDHILEESICDFGGEASLDSRLSHILWHLQRQKEMTCSLLTGDSEGLLMNSLKKQLLRLFSLHIKDFTDEVPYDFVINHLSASFCEAIRWWVHSNMEPEPSTVSGYFLKINGI